MDGVMKIINLHRWDVTLSSYQLVSWTYAVVFRFSYNVLDVLVSCQFINGECLPSSKIPWGYLVTLPESAGDYQWSNEHKYL